MSTILAKLKNTGKTDLILYITQYAGPKNKGKMLQLNQGPGGYNIPGYIDLTKDDAIKVAQTILDWLKEN